MYHTEVVLARFLLIQSTQDCPDLPNCAISVGDGQDGGREDRRDDTAHVDLQRQVGGGATVHLTADHAARVLHGDAALAQLDEVDEDKDDHQHAGDDAELQPIAVGAVGAPTDLPQLRQEAGADGHEDQDGHTLTDALVGDQLGHPHDQAGTTGHDQNHDGEVPHGVVRNRRGAHVVEQCAGLCGHQNRGGLQHGQANGEVTRVLRQLGLTGLSFLVQRLEARDDHAQQLHDDGSGNVRHDTQRENGQLQHCTAREEVDQADEVFLATAKCVDTILHRLVVDSRRRDARTNTVDDDHG